MAKPPPQVGRHVLPVDPNDWKRQTIIPFRETPQYASIQRPAVAGGGLGGQFQTLGIGDLFETVALPANVDKNEWLAANAAQFLNDVNLMVAMVKEFCTVEKFPHMTAGKQRYKWQDEKHHTEPVDLPAIEYMEKLLYWANDRLNDEAVCPTEEGVPFPENFEAGIKMMFRRFFRVYAHIYHHQFRQLEELGITAHLNHVFKRFILFNMVFELLSIAEMEPLKDLVEQIWSTYKDGAAQEKQ